MRLCVWLFVLLASGCASNVYKDLDSLHTGMDKSEVLDVAGTPKRTFRSNSQDHWIYVFYVKDEEWVRQIDFAQGKVIAVDRAHPKKDFSTDLENTQTFEEFEQKAREHSHRAQQFKDVDGSN